jgi:hypothetical protein
MMRTAETRLVRLSVAKRRAYRARASTDRTVALVAQSAERVLGRAPFFPKKAAAFLDQKSEAFLGPAKKERPPGSKKENPGR